MVPWKAVNAQTTVEAWRVCRPVDADSHQLDEKQDQDPHWSEKLDPDWIRNEVKKAGSGSGFELKWKAGSGSGFALKWKARSGSTLKWCGSETLDRKAGETHLWLWGRSPRSPRPRSCSPCRGTFRCPPPAPPWWSGYRPPETKTGCNFDSWLLSLRTYSQDENKEFVYLVLTREMGNLSRGPTFGDFVTIRIEASMQDITVARLRSTRVQTPLPPSFKCNVLRESLSVDSQNIPCGTLKRRGSWVISIYLWF